MHRLSATCAALCSTLGCYAGLDDSAEDGSSFESGPIPPSRESPVDSIRPAAAATAVRAALAKAPGGADIAITEGDFFVDPIPDGHDVFLLSNVAHLHLPEKNIELLRRVRAAAPAGARVLLIDFWTNSARTEPVFAALVAAEFQIVTGEGDVYPVDTAFDWLKQAGFEPIDHRPLSGAASLIVGEAI